MPSFKKRLDQRWKPTYRTPLLILDNRDSFVFNLAHRFGELGEKVSVARSDEVKLEELVEIEPQRLVISPGPGHPDEAGLSIEAIRRFSEEIPILGICLGHQAIGRAFGAQVLPGGRPRHGVDTAVTHLGLGVLRGLPTPFQAARYHSLIVEGVEGPLEVTAWSEGVAMALRHETLPLEGLQFHPESILTELGLQILQNFLRL